MKDDREYVDYFDVVWKTVTDDLPTLKIGLASILEAEGRN
jgi:uncharacterized protein with HEPN domain